MFENNPFATHTIEILIMLLGAFFIGLWLGWVLWGRIKEELERLRVDNQSLNVTLDTIRLEFESARTRAVVAETDNSTLGMQLATANRDITALRENVAYLENELADVQNRNRQVETELGLSFSPDSPVAENIPFEIKETVAETSIDEGDLLAPEPIQEQVMISTSESIQEVTQISTPEPIQEIVLTSTPEIVIDPEPAADPKPEKSSKQKSPASDETTPAPAISSERDDLTVVEGIGPKIQMLLNQYGIFTYRQLAEADVVRLKEILAAAGSQLAMHDPGTWPSQANLAANDQWDTLKSVQGFLKGGKKPD